MITVTPTVDTSLYATGDHLGSLMTLADVVDSDGEGVILDAVMVLSKAVLTTPSIRVLLFDEAPTLTSSDNDALSITDAEMADKCVGSVNLVSGDAFDIATGSVLENKLQNCHLDCVAGSRTLYAILMAQTAQTYGSTTDLTVKFKFRCLF